MRLPCAPVTGVGWALAVFGWAGFWADAVLGPTFLALVVLTAVFFVGLGLGAYDQHRQRRTSPQGDGSGSPALTS